MDHHKFLRILIRENLERQILYEGLIYSYSPSLTIKKIKRLGFKDVVYDIIQNTIVINFILDKNNKERYGQLNNTLYNVYGWNHGMSVSNGSPTKDKLDFIKYNGTVTLKYEAKFDIELSEIPDKFYHLTTCDKLKNILKKGLTPRSSKDYFTFEDRIYFSLKPELLIGFIKQKTVLIEKNCFIILEISTNGITDRIRFFKDPNFKDGIYTLENIMPFAIIPILKIEVDGSGNIISKKKI